MFSWRFSSNYSRSFTEDAKTIKDQGLVHYHKNLCELPVSGDTEIPYNADPSVVEMNLLIRKFNICITLKFFLITTW